MTDTTAAPPSQDAFGSHGQSRSAQQGEGMTAGVAVQDERVTFHDPAVQPPFASTYQPMNPPPHSFYETVQPRQPHPASHSDGAGFRGGLPGDQQLGTDGMDSLVAFASLAAQNMSLAVPTGGETGHTNRRSAPQHTSTYPHYYDDAAYGKPPTGHTGRKRGRASSSALSDYSDDHSDSFGSDLPVLQSKKRGGGGKRTGGKRQGRTINPGASNRKPLDESRDDGSGSARQLVGERWAENPRLTTLVNSLSSRVRHFAMFEWFYATIDRDYFNHNEFKDCLDNSNLRHIHKLTRTEWSAVRSTLGKARRLSPAFLYEERVKLENYRQTIREVQKGSYLPPRDFAFEIPAPLVVGQTVSAYHKRAKLLSRGQILTADYDKGLYRVHFERPELGSEICADTEIAVHGAPTLLYAKPRRDDPPPPPLNGELGTLGEQLMMAPPPEEGENARAKLMVFILKMLDRKEALLTALRELNQQAESMGQSAPTRQPSLYPPVFKQQYTWVVGALSKTNAALNPALEKLRQLVTEADGGNGKSSPALFDLYYGMRVSPTVKQVVESSRQNARVLYQHHSRSRQTAQYLQQNPQMEGLIEACAAVILVLRQCADQRRQGLMTATDVEQCVGAVLQELKMRCPNNAKLFNEVESSVALLKSELLL